MSIGYGSHEPVGHWHSAYDHGEAVCVIGAGPSGLLATKNLREHGFRVDCYERETGVGGAWNWRHDRSPVTASTYLVSSRATTEFPDFPMPDSWPDYPHHRQVLSYLDRYADHFDLRPHIWFGTEVVQVRPDEQGRWQVTTRSTGGVTERTHRYAAVVVASGAMWSPVMPDYEGLDEYTGQVRHAREVKDPAQLRDRRVLVLGAGNTGADLAVEAAQRATQCWHSRRRGYWHLPKYLRGRPADQLHARARWWRLPAWARHRWFVRMLRVAVGDLRRLGLPGADHRVYDTTPVLNSQYLHYLRHRLITPVPDVARFHHASVELADGRTIEPDLVVMATGYRPRYEFADPALLAPDAQGNPRLHLHMFSPAQPTLAVVGLPQPPGGLFPLVHWQTVTIARWLRLRDTDPARASAVWSRISSPPRRWSTAKAAVAGRRWYEVDRVRYLRALQQTLDDLEVAR